MARADFQISIQGGEPEGQWLRFEPGSQIAGTAQIVTDGDVKCNHLYIRLQWHTEGRGDRDTGKVAEIDVFQGVLNANVPVSYNFNFTAPRDPWSYAGHYINIIWEVVAELDIPLAPDMRGIRPIILAPGAPRFATAGG